jgi:ribokinase
MQPQITVLGSYNQDLVMFSPRLPLPKETIIGARFEMFPGGKGANQAHAAGRAGGNVQFIGKIGADSFGSAATSHLQAAGVHLEGLMVDPSQKTGCAMILVEESTGQNQILVASGANMQIQSSELKERANIIENAKLLVCQFETNPEAIETAIEIARHANVPVCLNPAPMRSPFPMDLLNNLDFFIPNEIEAQALLGYPIQSVSAAKKGVQELVAMGVKNAIITLGDKGCVAADQQRIWEQPAFTVKAVDTTGAGDTFIGAFAVGWLDFRDIQKALRFASAAAALKVTKQGASIANPSRFAIDTFLREN